MKFSTILAATGLIAATEAAHLQIAVAPSTLVPSPSTQISHSTSAYLTRAGQVYAAPLSADGWFDFRNVSGGSYLVDVVGGEYLFAPLRVDVLDTLVGEVNGQEVKAWGTWRGNEWSNHAEEYAAVAVAGSQGEQVKRIAITAAGRKEVFVDRVGFSITSILRNPMILMAGVACAMMFGMPYLLDTMDDETRAEFEERQKSGPMATLMGGGAAGGKKKEIEFDPAGWLAGRTAKGKSS